MPSRDIETARARGRERHRRSRDERAALGLCRRCGARPVAPGRANCDPSAEKRRAADRARAEKRLQAGIKRVRNPEARKAEYRRARQRAEDRLARGICSKCGRRPNEPERRLCISCGQQRRAAERERYARARSEGLKYGGKDPVARRTLARQRTRNRQRARRAAWICTHCGSRPSFGASRCEPRAKNAWERSEQVKGLPVYPPRFTVVERATGTEHGNLEQHVILSDRRNRLIHLDLSQICLGLDLSVISRQGGSSDCPLHRERHPGGWEAVRCRRGTAVSRPDWHEGTLRWS